MGDDTNKVEETGAVKPPRRKGSCLRFGCAIGILLLLVPFAVNLMLTYLAREGLKRELERARKDGMPGSLIEVAPAPIPSEENAALAYNAAFGLMAQGTPKEETALEVLTGWVVDREKEQKALPDAKTYLEKNRAALDRIRQGAKLPHCRFDVPYNDPMFTLPHLAPMRRAAKLLQTDARVLLAEGRTSEALGVIDDMYRLGEALRGEPLLISLLVRLAMRNVADSTLRRALQQPLDDPKRLAALAETLERTVGTEQLVLVTQGERVRGMDGIERVRRGQWTIPAGFAVNAPVVERLYSILGWMACRDEAFFVRVMGEYARLARVPYAEARAEVARVDREVSSASEMYFWTREMTPALGAARLSFEKDVARHGGARIAVALVRYKLAHGGYPKTPDALVPKFLQELPKDPFTGAPYRYLRRGDSARVYSLGEAGTDLQGGDVGAHPEENILLPLGDQAPFGR